MAFSFPLSTSFMDLLPIGSTKVYNPGLVEVNQSAAGELITADLGARLWRGDVTVHPRPHVDMAMLESRLSLLQRSDASFMAYDVRQYGPKYDPTGSIMGASTPVLNTIDTNRRDIKISGLPPNYELWGGDLVGFTYGSSPTRYAYHQVVSYHITANGSGLTTSFVEVTPPLRPGATVSTPVTLIRPTFKAVIVPGSVMPSEGARGRSGGLSFSFIQTLR